FDTYKLASGGANSLTLTNANFARLPGPITIEGGDTGSTIDASGLSAVHAVAIHASSGTDILTGGAGADTFYGAAGNETIDGGAGIDTMVLQGPASGYTINVVGPVTTITGAGVVDTLTNVENIRYAPAAPTGLALTPVSDSGASNTDNLTNVTLPTFVGAGENGDTITLYDGSTTFGTGTVAGGIWSITATVPLTTGANTFTATQTNTLGDVSLASAPLTVRLDTVALAPAALVLTAASDSGASSSDHITNVTLPTVTGTGENGATVTLFDGGTAIGTGTVTGGAWSITATVPLVGGVNDVYAMQTDLAGNISAPSSDLFVTLLTAAPAPGAVALTPASDTGASNTDDITRRTLPRITGTGDNGDTVTLSNGGTIIGTGTVAGGVWSILTTVALTEGVNAITAMQTDLAGNVSPAATLSVTLDTVALPPAALALTPASDSGASNSDDITNVTLPTVTGTGENGAVVTLFDGGTALGTGTVSGGVWSITATVPLVNGQNDLYAQQTDVAGNVSAPSGDLFVTLITATVPPPGGLALAAASDSGTSNSDDLTNVAQPTITGTGVDGDTITLSDGGTLLGTATVAGGVWSIAATAPLLEGANAITATESDSAGNTSAASSPLNVRLKTSAPAPTALALVSPSSSTTANLTVSPLPTITGAGENGDTVTLLDGATIIGTGMVTGGAWSITATVPLIVGVNPLTAREVDVAGNVSAPSSVLNVTLDPNLPAVTAMLAPNPADAHSNGMVFSPIVVGSGDPTTIVSITEAGATVATVQSNATGAWSFDPSSLPQGIAHSLVASETDAAGNTSSTFPLTVPASRFTAVDVTTSTSGSLLGSDYAGPVGYLQAQYAYTGSDNVVISASVANVFIHGGSAEEA
ncbi:MAG: large repetitive protein, partial [Acetobacteraceae bacterium]|nr:large repetitive protein [Acetobacteraceae bacterium]